MIGRPPCRKHDKTFIIRAAARAFLFAVLCLGTFSAAAQVRLAGYRQADINERFASGYWPAHWISVPQENNGYGVRHFRKTFELERVPAHFTVHVSADNRYKLYVNGRFVCLGPVRCDPQNWNYETVDLAPWLREGRNVIAAVVWNFDKYRPVAQMSFGRTEFLVQGDTDTASIVNTDSSWRCIADGSYGPMSYAVRGYFAAGNGERVDAALYPWGWEQPDYDDSLWPCAVRGLRAAAKGTRDYFGRQLVPSPTPSSELAPVRFSSVAGAAGVDLPEEFPRSAAEVRIPARSEVRILLDQGVLTTGYPRMDFSGGRGAEIKITYAEALYDGNGAWGKGDRNVTEGKSMIGYSDCIVADGGDGRSFVPLWWRTWRYVALDIRTADEPLTLHDVCGMFSAYPFELQSEFSAPESEELSRMLEIGWRTARLCANETYMDCPYYEQLQYFGDTRIQAMITMYNTRDAYMVRHALEQGRRSMISDGITRSRYPSDVFQMIPSFSIWWIGTAYDYWMYRGDEAYLKTLLPAFRSVMSWYESFLGEDCSLYGVPYWFFIDWADGLPGGQPLADGSGASAYHDALYLLGLGYAESMERAFGSKDIAEHYRKTASAVRKSFHEKYWVEERGLFADDSRRETFSQHVNSMAVLADAVTGRTAREVMHRVMEGERMIAATLYFRYYVNMAMARAGLGDMYLDCLGPWREQMTKGLTTWAETPDPTRSDCHAWSASPNIELYRTVLGISSASPAFGSVRIAPSLCGLASVSGSIPHPAGEVSVSYDADGRGGLTARVSLPEGVDGTFVWRGKSRRLHGGEQILKF